MTDRELDAQIHERIFELPHWEPFMRSEIEGEPCGTMLSQCRGRENRLRYANETASEQYRNSQRPRCYSTDISAAMEVVEKMNRYPEDVHDAFLEHLARNCPSSNQKATQVIGWALSISNKPEWVCKAALAAVSLSKL